VAWAYGLRKLIIPGTVLGLAGMPFDQARNVACQQTVQNGFTHVCMLDSDVIPPPDGILRLLSHNQPFVSGLYCRRSPPWSVPVMQRPIGQWVVDFPQNGVIEVDVVGSGFLLIHRSVLEYFFENPQRPGNPVFDWRVNMAGLLPQGECLSEDFTLCKAYRERCGGKVLVDCSVRCLHVGMAQAEFMSYRPLDTMAVA
jgi:hypothetical protein